MTQDGSDVVLKLDANDDVRIQNTKISDFTASNLQLRLDTTKLGAMTFDDEFNSLSTRNRNDTKGTWNTEFGAGDPNSVDSHTLRGNNEKEFYVDPTTKGQGSTALGLNPFTLDNGVLTITEAPTPAADKAALYGYDYTSGYLSTRAIFAQTYGYFEARMRLPTGLGAWPAFWLVRQDGTWPPELDILEAWNDTTAVSTMHTAQTGTHTMQSGSAWVPDGDTSMHTYGMLWTPTTITFYVDGAATFQTATPADMHSTMYMVLNLAVSPQVQDPNLTTQLKVDYVHAYSLADLPVNATGSAVLPTGTGSATTGSGSAVSTSPGTQPSTPGLASPGTASGTTPAAGSGGTVPAKPATADHGYWGKNPALADGFNAEYYAAHNPDVVAAGMGLHDHYLKYGKAEDRLPYDPNATTAATVSSRSHAYWGAVAGAQDVNAAYYAAHNPDLVAAGVDMLAHYELYGKAEGRLAYDPTAVADAHVASAMATIVAPTTGNSALAATSAHDTFVFSAGFGTDTVSNFSVSSDKLDVTALLAKYGNPTLTDMASGTGTAVHWSGGETIQLLGVSHADAQHAVFG